MVQFQRGDINKKKWSVIYHAFHGWLLAIAVFAVLGATVQNLYRHLNIGALSVRKLQSSNKSKQIKSAIPSVLLAGAQKASTSSVAVHFMDKGNACFSDEELGFEGSGKEPHFFDWDHIYAKGLKNYQELFKKCKANELLIDGTPETMLYPDRVKKTFDEQGTADQVKIVFILREPVSREISWYDHQVRYAEQSDPPFWAKPVLNEDGTIISFIESQRRSTIINFEMENWEFLYGNYVHWLRLWCNHFDRKQILVLSYDELVKDPAQLLNRIYKFLDIPVSSSELVLTRENTRSNRTSPPPCSDQLELAEDFKEPNEELYRFLEEHPGPEMEQRPFPKFQLACQTPLNGTGTIETQKPPIPSVLLAGTQKAGSTSIANYLMSIEKACFSNQGQLSEGSSKEAHFFDWDHVYAGGLQQYQKLFENCGTNDLLIDASQTTMLYPRRVKKMYKRQGTLDQVKIIFILREPVSREISWYNHKRNVARRPDPPKWAKTLVKNDGTIASFIEIQRTTVMSDIFNSEWERVYGTYVHWLKLWCKNVDRKQILVLSFDELVNDPEMMLLRIHKFLDIPLPSGELVLPQRNTDFLAPPPPPCIDQLELAEYFIDSNEELYKFLDENPGPAVEQRPFPKFRLQCQEKKEVVASPA